MRQTTLYINKRFNPSRQYNNYKHNIHQPTKPQNISIKIDKEDCHVGDS